MISTLYLLQFIAFYLWQMTARSAKKPAAGSLFASIAANKKGARVAGGIILLASAIGFVFNMGLLAGICGFIVGLMGVGCLSVALAPFNYLRLPGVAALYVCSIALEILL